VSPAPEVAAPANGAAPPAAPQAPLPAVPRGGRRVERSLLLWNLPLALLAAAGVAAAQVRPGGSWAEIFVPAVMAVGSVWLACMALHVLLWLTKFDGDELILPLLSLLLLVGGAYHLDLMGPKTPGLTPAPYTKAALTGVGVLALVTASGRWFKRLSILIEERIWWRVAGDRPYYESVPFHFLLIGLMGFLAVLLMFRGIRSQEGALIQVPLPGGIRFTPSEVIRLAVAFFLADYLGRNSRLLRNLRQPVGRVWPLNRLHFERRAELVVLLTTVLLYCLFFYAFRDFGPAAVIILLTLTALYAATGRALTPVVLGVGCLGALVGAMRLGLLDTMRNRVEMWFSPWNTHFVNGDHQARILWAISTGGWFGMGVGTHNLPGQLPLARNDAAFAGVAATMGMWVGLAVLAVFAALTWRGMVAARQAPTDRMRLLAFCLTSLLAYQAVWICGAMVSIFPFTGINVPFISTGLSNMVVSSLALGTIWNISRVRGLRPDATESTPEVLRGVTRLAVPVTAAFALPAIGLLLYGCPWLLGNFTMTRAAKGIGRKREVANFSNPYIERFRLRFPRGRVFSADEKLLAVSNPSPTELDAIRELSPSLARYVERREREGGVGERYYPLGTAAAQLVGWSPQGRFAAKAGSVETSWDALLRGYQPDQLPFYFRNRHNPLVRPPRPQDLQLTVDASLQQFAQRRLATAVRQWNGAGGALTVYDVTTGAVLCAVTAPAFDPNNLTLERMTQYIQQNSRTQVLTNKALARDALYFPGSTFKILTAGAGLAEGLSGSVTCNGGNVQPVRWEHQGKRWRRDPGKISDFSRGGHGTLDLGQGMDYAFTVSCNVFFGSLAAQLGPDRLHRAMQDAELAEAPPVAQLAEYLPYSGFGQINVKTSPLEMAMLAGAAAVAQPDASPNAAASRPHWVHAVLTKDRRRDPEGAFGAPNTKPYRPFPAPVAQRLRQMMVQVVQSPSGTAHSAFYRGGAPRLPGITVGGKTGTAEFEKTVKGAKGSSRTMGRHAWFVGFARSDHELQPRTLAYAVLVEDVRRGGTGGQVCAPVARDILARILPAPGENPPGGALLQGLERFYEQQVRSRLGPLGPLVDWLRGANRR